MAVTFAFGGINMTLKEFVESSGGAVGTVQLASFFDIRAARVSAGAESNEVPVIGRGYAFSYERAAEFAAEALGYEEDAEEEEDESQDTDEDEQDDDGEEEEEEDESQDADDDDDPGDDSDDEHREEDDEDDAA